MSLDVYLHDEDGSELFWANITHNLGKMADAAGIYEALWRPEEQGWTKAKEIAPVIETGLLLMIKQRQKYQEYDAANGWGTYDQFVPWIARYLEACYQFPDATIYVSR